MSTGESGQRQAQGASTDHVEQDAAQQQESSAAAARTGRGLSLQGGILVFLVFPMSCGLLGMYVAYLQKTFRDSTRVLDFDTDFVVPFLVALTMVIVIYCQTNRFQSKFKPLVTWPKVRRVKKITRKRIIVDDDGKELKMDWNPSLLQYVLSMSV